MQQLTGLSTAAFSEMAQWRSASAVGEPFVALPQSLLTSGPASPLPGENLSPSLHLDLGFDVEDVPDLFRAALLGVAVGRKRAQDDTGTGFFVPTPKKASLGKDADEKGGAPPPGRERSPSASSRRISFTTPPLGGRPGSSLSSSAHVDGCKGLATNAVSSAATNPSVAAGSSAARADTSPFVMSHRSVSPFTAYNKSGPHNKSGPQVRHRARARGAHARVQWQGGGGRGGAPAARLLLGPAFPSLSPIVARAPPP